MRRSYLDNIRWMTIVFVVIYHVLYMYNGEGIRGGLGKITDLSVQYYDVYMYMVYPWFMAILFIVAGMCARFYLESHSDHDFIRSRSTKLLVPRIGWLFTFAYLQGYISIALGGGLSSLGDAPGAVKVLIMLWSGTGVLWFVEVLWLFSMLLVPVRKIEKDRLWTIGAKTGVPALVLMAIPVWAAAQVLNTPIVCVYRFGLYAFLFLVGYFVFSHDEVIERLKKWSPMFIAIAAVFGAAFCVRYFGENYADAPVNRTPLFTGFCWFACMAVLGGFARFGDVSNGLTSWMSKRSFGLYMFHYLCMSIVALYIGKPGLLSAPAVYLVSAFAGFGGALLLAEIVTGAPLLRWALLGMKKNREVENVQR